MNPNKIFEPITKNEDFKYAKKTFKDISIALLIWIFVVVIGVLVSSWILTFSR